MLGFHLGLASESNSLLCRRTPPRSPGCHLLAPLGASIPLSAGVGAALTSLMNTAGICRATMGSDKSVRNRETRLWPGFRGVWSSHCPAAAHAAVGHFVLKISGQRFLNLRSLSQLTALSFPCSPFTLSCPTSFPHGFFLLLA